MGVRVPEHQTEPRHVPPRPSFKRSLFKWLGLATAGALLIGTAPAAGSLPPQPKAASAASSASTGSNPSRSVQPVFAMVAGTSPLRDPSAGSGPGGGDWTPGYQPEITSVVSPDGSPADGEGIPSRRGVDHVTTGPTGLLPGGLALAAPVESTRITSSFGWRLNPTGPGSYIHIGQDYGVACGTPVRAAADGRVVQSAWAGHSGQRVRVDHGSGVETAYSHNSLLVASTGERVQRGDLLALSGTTGNSTGCHVHFEVYLNGKWVDPAKYLPLVPGQKRPVSEQELRQIARSRTSSAPSPSPARSTTAASSTSPAPSHQAGKSSHAAASKTPIAAGPATNSPKPAAQPRPTKSTSPTPIPTHRPQEAGSPSKPKATEDPKPSQPTKDTERKPTASSTKPATSAPSGATPPTTTPSAVPVESASPSKKPTAKPAPSETQTPKPTPTPSSTPEEPTASPDPGTIEPATLASLCVAYQREDKQWEEAGKKNAKTPDSRQLSQTETMLLAKTFGKERPDTERTTADDLNPKSTVHDVVLACVTWFPQGIDPKTEPADISALMDAAAAKAPSAKDTGNTGK